MKKTTTPTQAEYHTRELRTLAKQIAGIESAPISDRRAARAEYQEAMADYPALVAERISWLFNGSYGYGACVRSKEICAGRGNKVGALSQLVAILEWRCPADFARQAWHTLTPAKQAKLAALIQAEIDGAQLAV